VILTSKCRAFGEEAITHGTLGFFIIIIIIDLYSHNISDFQMFVLSITDET
jgi:hypothetical protein